LRAACRLGATSNTRTKPPWPRRSRAAARCDVYSVILRARSLRPKDLKATNERIFGRGNRSLRMTPFLSETIENCIQFLRGQKVILSIHLAEMYGVETRILVRNVKRHVDRFPADFMFQLTDEEWLNLKSQFGISSWGGVRRSPYAFTEQGVAMLSSVLNSPRAVQANIEAAGG
jgi:hypothetical protein